MVRSLDIGEHGEVERFADSGDLPWPIGEQLLVAGDAPLCVTGGSLRMQHDVEPGGRAAGVALPCPVPAASAGDRLCRIARDDCKRGLDVELARAAQPKR